VLKIDLSTDKDGKSQMSFGFQPSDGQPDFEALFKQFSEMGIDSETLAGAKSFVENMQSATSNNNQNLINPSALRAIAKKIIATKGDLAVGLTDQQELAESIAIANTWLDTEILFPAATLPTNTAWSKSIWLEESLLGWQSLIEPLARGMADALARVITSANTALPIEITAQVDQSPEQQEMMKQMVAKLLRSFMGTLIANQLGQGIGLLANSITSANDVAIPLLKPDSGSHLIPQNIVQWADGLGIEKTQVNLYLALREVAASRLFSHNSWLQKYLSDAITSYGQGITIDVESITRQAEEAMANGEIDINNPQSINIALNSGLFTPEQTPAQELALTKLEMVLALIEGWIDHVISQVAAERIPSFNALIENSRRRRATNSPMQQMFASLLGLEISPRKLRESAAFWSEVKNLRGCDGRDKCWEDPAFLPMPKDLNNVKAFLDSVTVPDDLSGLI
jgi:putative hydrolase